MSDALPAPDARGPATPALDLVLLETPGTAEVVTAGSVALFAVALAGVDQGVRRYVTTIEAGEALLPSAPLPDALHRLVAAPLGEVAVERRSFATLAQDPLAEGARLIASWARRLAGSLGRLPAPLAVARVVPGDRAALGRGRAVEPERGAAWLVVREGRGKWVGLDAFMVDASSGPVPMAPGLWLEAASEKLVVEALSTEEVARDLEAFTRGVATLERGVLAGLAILEIQDRRAKQRQLREKQKRSSFVAQGAFAEIASVLRKRDASVSEEGSPLFLAAAAAANALGIALRPPGGSEDLERLASPIEAIARASRVRVRKVMLRRRWWREDGAPLVATLTEGARPVALLPLSAGRYELFDPQDPRHRPIVDRTVAARLEPTAFMLYRPLPEAISGARDVLRFSLRGRTRDLAWMLGVALVGALVAMAVPVATGVLVDSAIPDGDRGLLAGIAVALGACAVAGAALQVSAGLWNVRFQTGADHDLQAALWDRLLRLRMSFFRRFAAGDLHTRVTAVRRVRQLLSGTVTRTLLASALSLLDFALLAWYSWRLSLLALGIFVVQVVATAAASAAIVRQTEELVAVEGSLMGLLVQLVNGVSKLRVTGAERRAFARWAKDYARQQKVTLRVKEIRDHLAVLSSVLSVASMALIFGSAVELIERGPAGSLTIGGFLAFSAAFGIFLGGAATLSETVTNVLEVVNLTERARPILAEPPEVDHLKADPGPLAGRVALDRVDFRYRPGGPLVLDQVSLRAEPGELVAVVGESGSGKSTLLRLLLGFETPESGTVSYDENDLAGLDADAVRRQLGAVLQANRIQMGSLLENIACGRVVSVAEAEAAVRDAGLADDVAAMPMGLHTIVSEGGTNLSGGQRQRLLIARAIVARPRVLVFDEATSALDNRTQAIVNESLESLRVTRIVVAHRLSTIRKANRIYVLEKGRVVQAGGWEELAREKGIFAQLLARQRA